jgi:E3 ubiquitin-protein ligase HUWE1
VIDFRTRISQLIAANPTLLESSFPFARRYSFLLDFPLKFKLFRDKARDRQTRRRTHLRIRRDSIIADSFEQLRFADMHSILGEFVVTFVDEPAIDLGGVRRDWYTSLVRALFNPEYALFTPDRVPSPVSGVNPDHIQFFNFAGRVIAKAVFDGVPLDCHLPAFLCKEIVGAQIGLADFEADPTFGSLKWILENDPEPLEMYFVADEESLGVHTVVPLKKGGDRILVTEKNKEEYVNLFVRHRLIGRVKPQIEAFVGGFHTVLIAEDVQMFAPNELDLVICGIPSVDVKDLRTHCAYVYPLSAEHYIVQWFFAIIRHWSKEDLAKLVLFVTGSSQVPVGGFKTFADSGFPFTIAAGGNSARLPVAHTCTHTIDLPSYQSLQEMSQKLHLAITECSSFGFA